ncbi:hypothetical protein BDK51DRAFT_17195, partial [Blyttiomyces helicus]
SIIALNVVVFALWRVPALAGYNGFMTRHFTHLPSSSRAYTLLTSAFSHESLVHIGVNMYALAGFLPALQIKGFGSTEQTLAFYVAAAVVASLGSHLVSALWLSRLGMLKPSLGASGAIWAVLISYSIISPDSRIGIVFLPGTDFAMSDLVPALVCLDIAGLVMRWQMFDHAAHLAGAAFGYWYLTYGRDLWVRGQLWLDEKKIEEDRTRRRGQW